MTERTTPPPRTMRSRSFIYIAIGAAVPAAYAAFALRAATGVGEPDRAAWDRHRAEIARIPEEEYHKDRYREVRGKVTKAGGAPVAGVVVRMHDVAAVARACEERRSANDLARMLAERNFPAEAETTTDAEGKFNFPSPASGLKALTYSAAGYGPAWRDCFIVHDSYSSWYEDVVLEPAKTIRIDAPKGGAPDGLLLFGDSLWAGALRVGASGGSADGAGGALSGGRVVALQNDHAVDCGRWEPPASGATVHVDIPNAAAAALSRPAPTQFLRNPAVLLLQKADKAQATAVEASAGAPPAGTLHGFLERGFLPVSVHTLGGDAVGESFAGPSGEFTFDALPPGPYLLRTIGEGGVASFPRAAYVREGATTDVSFTILDHVVADSPKSRVIHGLVRDAAGMPVPKASVWCQDVRGYRYYARQSDADASGYYRFGGIEAGAAYIVFAQLHDRVDCVKNFENVVADSESRETWHDSALHRTVIHGDAPSNSALVLEVSSPAGEWRPLWQFSADAAGRFSVTGVLPGNYRVRARAESGAGAVLWGPGAPEALQP